jgi:hypothetical protein
MPVIDPSNPLGLFFVVSFAIQQILEALSWPVEKRFGEGWKKTVLGVVGFIVGLYLASHLDLHVFKYFIPDAAPTSGLRGGLLDLVLTALVLSAGTEGTNSVLKFLKYLKEDKKAQAAGNVSNATVPRESPTSAGAGTAGTVTPAAVPVSPRAIAAAPALSYIGNK